MIANLKIICQFEFHAHPVHQNNVDFFGPRYIGDDFFKVESSVIQFLIVLDSNCTEKD